MLPATKDDPRQRKPDITLAGEQLGWKPVVSILHFDFYIFVYFGVVFALFSPQLKNGHFFALSTILLALITAALYSACICYIECIFFVCIYAGTCAHWAGEGHRLLQKRKPTGVVVCNIIFVV